MFPVRSRYPKAKRFYLRRDFFLTTVPFYIRGRPNPEGVGPSGVQEICPSPDTPLLDVQSFFAYIKQLPTKFARGLPFDVSFKKRICNFVPFTEFQVKVLVIICLGSVFPPRAIAIRKGISEL